MKIHVVFASLLVVVVAMASFIPGRAQEASANAAEQAPYNYAQAATQNWAGGNPLKIALLK
jgi:hypothetical protein